MNLYTKKQACIEEKDSKLLKSIGLIYIFNKNLYSIYNLKRQRHQFKNSKRQKKSCLNVYDIWKQSSSNKFYMIKTSKQLLSSNLINNNEYKRSNSSKHLEIPSSISLKKRKPLHLQRTKSTNCTNGRARSKSSEPNINFKSKDKDKDKHKHRDKRRNTHKSDDFYHHQNKYKCNYKKTKKKKTQQNNGRKLFDRSKPKKPQINKFVSQFHEINIEKKKIVTKHIFNVPFNNELIKKQCSYYSKQYKTLLIVNNNKITKKINITMIKKRNKIPIESALSA